MIGRGDSLVGLLALGESLSEEPYAREDKRMLEAVADPKTNDGYDEPQLREPPSERRNWHLGIYESFMVKGSCLLIKHSGLVTSRATHASSEG